MVNEGILFRAALRQVEARLTEAGCPDADFDAAELFRLAVGADARLATAPLTAAQAAICSLPAEAYTYTNCTVVTPETI